MTHSKWASTSKSGYLRTYVAGTSINMKILFLSLKELYSIVHMIVYLFEIIYFDALFAHIFTSVRDCNSQFWGYCSLLVKWPHLKRILIYWDKVQIFDRSAQGSFVSFSYSITYWQFLKQLYSALKRQSLPSISTLLNSMWAISSKVPSFCIAPKHHVLVYEQYWSVQLWNVINMLHTNHTHHVIVEEILIISRHVESTKFFCSTEVSLVPITCKLI